MLDVTNLFISRLFLIVVAATLILYYIPLLRRLQLPIIIVASLYFYWLAAGNLLLILLASCPITAASSFAATRASDTWRKPAMISGIILNLSLLIFFKYKHFLMPEPVFAGWFGADPTWRAIYDILLPVGISFYVFHGISLIVDSWRNADIIASSGRISFFRHLVKTTHYISFFPQIVAGPITKGKDFYPQIQAKYVRDIPWRAAVSALIHGYFLKEVVANNLNQLTIPMMQPALWEAIPSKILLLMMIGYSAQIFADFAGYSLIAIGLAHLYGYRLPINFKNPYFAVSFSDFWRRWHITLSMWLKEYLYIPLGGNRYGTVRTCINVMIVMCLGGLWHGAQWRYAAWGIVHGLALVAERLIGGVWNVARFPGKRWLGYGWVIIRIPLVFAFVTCVWLFFRLDLVQDVLHYLELIGEWRKPVYTYGALISVTLAIFIGVVFIYHAVSALHNVKRVRPFLIRMEPYALGVLLFLCLVMRGQESAFIYFQF